MGIYEENTEKCAIDAKTYIANAAEKEFPRCDKEFLVLLPQYACNKHAIFNFAQS